MTAYTNIEELKADIVAKIYSNLAQAITGPILQGVLLSMVDTLDFIKANAAALDTEAQARYDADVLLRELIAQKQNIIADLGEIRAGALAGATAYQRPAAGIPASDLTQAVQNLLTLAGTAVQSLDPVTELIPAAATVSNQLADKAFVNSSIATNTANYISDNGAPFTSLADLEAYSGTLTNNDYAFVVGTDTAGNTIYTRYKYNAGTQTWAAEYVLNNSSFTAVQWGAINSGITAAIVASIAEKYVKPATGIPATDFAQAVRDSLGLADTAVQPAAITNMEVTTNKVTSIGAGATDQQYPSALAVKTALGTKAGLTPINAYPVAPVNGLEVSEDTYNRLDFEVGTLAIVLPAITDTTHVHSVVISMTTGANPNVTFSNGDNLPIEYFDGFSIDASTSYEINCLYNGAKWIVAYGIIA